MPSEDSVRFPESLRRATPAILDDRVCHLGEGPLWHPDLQRLFWFDILEKRLLSRSDDEVRAWDLPLLTSAAGWIDATRLLIADEQALRVFDLSTGTSEALCALEGDNPATRSNDGRADPWGGFWIGTMGKRAEPEAGAIYRFYRGELRRLVAPVSIPNAISFAPDGGWACFADTAPGTIWRQRLRAADGWPEGDPEPFVADGKVLGKPDGAVIDLAGRLWNARWGAASLACFDPDGRPLGTLPFPAINLTCPCFGGADLTTLFATSATEHMDEAALAAWPESGRTFVLETDVQGQAENRILL